MSAAMFRKKPVEIEATQWLRNGDHPDDRVGQEETDPISADRYVRQEGAVVRFFRRPSVPGDTRCRHCNFTFHFHGWIDTLEGGHTVCPGDWIITGVQGEFYPIKDAIFRETYEAVDPA